MAEASDSSQKSPQNRPVLHVCVTCRRGGPAMDQPPGAQLYARLQALVQEAEVNGQEAPVLLRQVQCLAACDRGCTAAIAMPERWTWLLGIWVPKKQKIFWRMPSSMQSPRGAQLCLRAVRHLFPIWCWGVFPHNFMMNRSLHDNRISRACNHYHWFFRGR